MRSNRAVASPWIRVLLALLGVALLLVILVPILSWLPYMAPGFGWFLLAAAFMLCVLVYAVIVGLLRRRRPDYTPPPVRFVPHWQMMSMLGLALLAILAAIVVPFIVGLLGR
ncbi:MAG: hypothetical protein ACHQ7N_17425 [Candidatus Methylomirabilales bacterium]